MLAMRGKLFSGHLSVAKVECSPPGKLKDRINGLVLTEGLFNGVLSYCLPVWVGAVKGGLQDLQVMQNRAGQLVLNYPSRSNRTTMLDKSEWMTINQLE